MEEVREITQQHDVLLIFDEIITGFRLSLGGAQQYYGVTPDLSTFGKAAGAGFPIAGVVGREDIMRSGVAPVGTFNANPLSVAACLATINALEDIEIYKHMDQVTKNLIAGVDEIAQKQDLTIYCGGEGSIWQIAFGTDKPMLDYRDNFKIDRAAYNQFRLSGLGEGVSNSIQPGVDVTLPLPMTRRM